MSIFKNGIKVSGQFEVGGTTGTSSDVITGGDTPGFTTPAAYFKGTFPHIPPLGQRSRAPKKLLMLGLGNSNWLGEAESGQIDREGIHRPEVGLFEVSQGRDHGAFYAAAEGELMQLRVPNQDNFRFTNNVEGGGPNWPTPSIDPVFSLGKAGPKMAAMKRVKALLPEIEEIAILTCAIGGSGLAAINIQDYRNVADWLPPTYAGATGDDGQALLYLVEKANAFLAANPDYECGWIAGQLGPIAGFAGMDDDEFRARLLAMLAYLRANVTGASQAVFTIHSMHPNMVSADYRASDQLFGAGVWGPIEDVILGFADDDPLLRTGVIDASPFTGTLDGKHHLEADFNEIGRLHGEAYVAVRMGLENAAALPECRFLPNDKGSLECVLGSGFRIHDQVTEKDPIMGTVLRAAPAGANQPAGFQTDVRLNNQEHTIFARVRFMQDPAGERPLFSGKTPAQVGLGRVMTTGTAEYEGASSSFDPLLETGSAKALTQYLWHSVAFVFDGTDIKAFRDGELAATGVGAGAVISQETLLELMDYGNGAGGGVGTTTETDARMTDIRVAPRALSDAEVQAWHNDQPDIVDGGTEKLVDTNNGGTAITLPLNAAAGEGWQYQRSSGTYRASFQKVNGNGLLSSEAGLPWDPNNDGTGVPTNVVSWLIEIKTWNTASAFVTAQTYGLDSNGDLKVRAWTNFMLVDPATGGWTEALGGAWQELTDDSFS